MKEEEILEQDDIPDFMKQSIRLILSPTLEEGQVRERCFHLVTGSAVFGVLISETPDSFIICMPATLLNVDGVVDGRAVGTTKITRLMRSAVIFLNMPDSEHRYYYYRWLNKNTDLLPSFFSKDRCDLLKTFVYDYESTKNKTKKSEPPVPGGENQSVAAMQDLPDGTGSGAFWSPQSSLEIH